MKAIERLADLVVDHSRTAIAVMLVLTVLAGTGAGMVDQSSSLEQFQSDTEEAQKLEYIEANFATGPENRTTVQLIVRGENVLDRESLVGMLELQRSFRADERINRTLAGDRPMVGVANVVATAAITRERATDLRRTAAEFERLNRSIARERSDIAQRRATLNGTATALRGALDTLRSDPDASVRQQFDGVDRGSPVELDDADLERFQRAATLLRNAENRSQVRRAYELGTQGVLAEEFEQLQRRASDLQERAGRLRDLGQQLRAQKAALENASSPTLDQQIAQLRSMNASQIDRTLRTVLSGETPGPVSPLAFMPTSYEVNDTTANATMLVVTQEAAAAGPPGSGSLPDAVTEAQLAMEELGASESAGNDEVIVFGSGIITQEINDSMADSLAIVGPLALLFVVVALVVAYRDLIDILLGVVGIVVVLVWTFGFMGWAGYAFNQIFIAVPVLLIGLSIDYAIHIFMRHRESREQIEDGVRDSMKVALGGVGIALTWVTATTVIGFLSNLTSPVPPIRQFGVVSSFGITAALLVFGVLVPALKVEIDGFLESRGRDRKKRAFGTGGGRFSAALSVGATAARKAPLAVLVLAVVVSAGGAYGASQVDTSFNQADFLAEDPPAWMDSLPEPFRPSDYSAKQHLEYVNRNFLREDSQAQILLQGDVTDPETLRRVESASAAAADSEVSKKLAGGEANIRSPLSVMRSVAASNATFAATFEDADTDGDGVPDRNLRAVYDQLFAVAGDRAASVVHRTEDGDYRAVRIVVSTKGGASQDLVTSEMRAVADGVDGGGLEATATGQTILFKIVQDQLLETVIQSLLITLVAVFAFLMVTYRVTEGSATLGAVTLMPVLFSVTWILGTMYLAGIPFNVLTGMITSLTVGLGVAYSIHLSERYNQELERTGETWTAMERAVTGTGGALLGSAATTVGGFGVLAFAILPPLQQFGIITGLTIVYAFLAAVLVLPSLLVVWTKYVGPGIVEGADAGSDTDTSADTDAGAGTDTDSGSGDGSVTAGAGEDD